MQIRMLREIDAMFEGAPQTRKTLEVKEEMLQNLMEKYNDLLAQGKSEEAAFNIALGSVGDISDLLEELQQPIPKVASFPEPDMSFYDDEPAQAPPAQENYARHHQASVVSIAVMMYILCPIPVIFIGGRFGLLLMFLLVAAATGMLVYYGMTKDKKAQPAGESIFNDTATSDAEAEKPSKMTKEQRRFFGSLSSALWLITTALYFVISFSTGAWHITWIIFLITAAANNVLRAFIDLFRSR